MKRALLIIIYSILSCQFSIINCQLTFSKGEEVFSTWEGFEVDKLASIWLIKRFVAPDASIIVYPKGEIITRGVQFDTPHSKISRQFNISTFESLITHYKIDDKKLLNLGKLIHDIEINIWERKVYQESREIEESIIEILDRGEDNDEIINTSNGYFDRLFTNISDELELVGQ
ncbi:MAG: hypothetical protein D8M57_19710 [Candidatus Scalindua sp. AMX11]|nr:hypothetical protein [Planctomycetota bacterium]RZV61018.1 MAG: hypothetical protein EX341_19015 [Candidatus Scalindua sp. SCAELEC01]TDE63167.1 MAG: hypothetical protein D8M57_19710 [Candidatus Scalindua sp. AMX11]